MKEQSPLKKVLIVSVVVFIAYLTWKHVSVSEEDRIMAVFAEIEEGLEQRKSLRVLGHISPDYHDSEGNKKPELRMLLQMLNRASEAVMVSIRKESITIEGDTAEAELHVSAKIVAQGRQLEPLPDQGAETMSANLKKEDGEWVVTASNFPPAVQSWLRKFRRIMSGGL